MSKVRWQTALAAMTALALSASAGPAEAQAQYGQVISANPFGLLLELFNGEYERVVSESATAGVGGSFFDSDDVDYLNADAFFRFYPQGTPFDGWAFGAKVGITSIDDYDTYFGFGFDVNRSWLLGRNNNFYVGLGVGLKRLVGVPDNEVDLLEYIPTFRIVNIGFAF